MIWCSVIVWSSFACIDAKSAPPLLSTCMQSQTPGIFLTAKQATPQHLSVFEHGRDCEWGFLESNTCRGCCKMPATVTCNRNESSKRVTFAPHAISCSPSAEDLESESTDFKKDSTAPVTPVDAFCTSHMFALEHCWCIPKPVKLA